MEKRKPPPLGARIRASGYMVRYRPDNDWVDTRVTRICWRRHPFPVWGVYFGVRSLSIGWLFPDGRTKAGGHQLYKCRKVGSITVYAIAINHRTVRYVLPRDVEEVES